MAPDYNDGRWHGWNGGECPVHPKTKVRAIEESAVKWDAAAEDCDWHSFKGAFRVVKVAPQECWISKTDPSTVIYQPPVYDPPNWRMFREVMDGDAQ